MKKVSFKLMATVAFASMMLVPTFAKETVNIKIIHTNDIHGNAIDNGKSTIGFAKFATYVDETRAQDDNVLVVDAGDMIQGVPFANLEKGESIVKLANEVGYDAMVPGNHEFDFGSDHLFNKIIPALNFPVIGANIYKGEERPLKPYVVKEIDGVKVGIFGITTEETTFKSHPSNTAGYTFADMIKEADQTVKELKEKEQADIIIMLGHLGLNEGEYTSDLVAKAVDGIDVIVDGHSHTALEEGMMVNDTLIVSTGDAFKNVGEVELTIQDGEVVNKQAELLGYNEFKDVVPDQKVLNTIEYIESNQKPLLEEVVGVTSVDLVGERSEVRTGETNLGQLAADALTDLTGAQIAITNGGGIRASIPAGNITMQDMITVFPFGNTVMVKEIKGSDIKAALEHGVSEFPNEKGAFPHTSGMTFTLNAYKEAGDRISDIKVNGEPIDLNKTYTMATNDFMAVGGDGYSMFAAYPIKAEYNTLMDTLLAYVQKLGVVEGKFEPRMTVVEKAPVEEKPEVVQETVIISLMKNSVSKGGQEVELGLFPYITEGRVMARLRDISTLLDVELGWDNQTKVASIKGQDIAFKVGENFAVVEGKKVALGTTTTVVDGRVHLPVAQIARILERKVSFDNTIKEVVIQGKAS